MRDRHGWGRSLVAVASGSALPYGYTVTLWSSGAVLTHAHGAPDIGRIALFIVGALAGYGVIGAFARRHRTPGEPEHGARILGGMANWMAVAGAVSAAWLASELPASPAWALGSAAATTVYLALAAVQLTAVASRSL